MGNILQNANQIGAPRQARSVQIATAIAGLVCLYGWFGCVLAFGGLASLPLEITTFHQFYSLSPEQAIKVTPVRLKGVVLCYDPGWNQLYVYDGAETAWLSPQLFQTSLQVGLDVEITGYTTFGQGNATLTNLHLQILGHGALPDAKRLEISQLGRDFGQWIEINGQVMVAETTSGRLSLVVQDKGQTCLVYVMGLVVADDAKGLPGCKVRIRGINASKTLDGHVASALVFAPGLNEVTVLERSSTIASGTQATSIDALLNREFGSWTNDQVHLNGIIASYKPGESIVVKDVTGSIRAQVIQTTPAEAEERVDVWGYLAVLQGETILRGAYFKPQHPAAASAAFKLAGQPVSEQTNDCPEITHYSEISKMRPQEASQGFRVRLSGIVIYADPDWGNAFIQGKSGAMYVALNQRDISAGQLVEVTGQTSPGGFAPEVCDEL